MDNITTVLSFTLAGLSILISAYLIWSNNKLRKEEQEKTIIKKRLDEFYAPFMMFRYESKNLYSLFTKGKPENFRTLRDILDGCNFNTTEIELLKEILEIGKKCRDLIVEKSGLIDKPELREDILPRYITHVYVLDAAYKNLIKGKTEDYDDFVFPREMDESILQHINFLQGQLSGRWRRFYTKANFELENVRFKQLKPTEIENLNYIKNNSKSNNERLRANIILLRNKKYYTKATCNILDVDKRQVQSCISQWSNEKYYKLFFTSYDKVPFKFPVKEISKSEQPLFKVPPN